MLKLYVIEDCPYCRKVRRAFDEMGIKYKVILAEWGTPEHEEAKRIGGKTQVPLLVDESRKTHLYESDEIIAYAKEHYGSKA